MPNNSRVSSLTADAQELTSGVWAPVNHSQASWAWHSAALCVSLNQRVSLALSWIFLFWYVFGRGFLHFPRDTQRCVSVTARPPFTIRDPSGHAVPALAAHAPCDLMEQCIAVGTAFYNAFFCRLWDGLRNFYALTTFHFHKNSPWAFVKAWIFFFPVGMCSRKALGRIGSVDSDRTHWHCQKSERFSLEIK